MKVNVNYQEKKIKTNFWFFILLHFTITKQRKWKWETTQQLDYTTTRFRGHSNIKKTKEKESVWEDGNDQILDWSRGK